MIEFKITCPHCNNKVGIKVNESDLGTRYRTSCPSCASGLLLKLPTKVKMAKPKEENKTVIEQERHENKKYYLMSDKNKYAETQKFELNQSYLTFGRMGSSSNSDLELITNDLRISRKHCILRKYNNGITIEDVSKGGTILNNNKLTQKKEVFLKNGDVLRMGQTFFKFIAEKQ